ncbi:restriction endonuclease [Nesterenkonia sp. PF2B19]|uniref:restriction endonuclease n=1 Tax=Nesterenkonia sp. PF2B19 TaxID=1881858 RepID=UPI000B29E6A4|nr:restriction endonuclease [Nesterenkonia sp. PF2B19]
MTISSDATVLIPRWHEFMRPVLQVLSDGESCSRRELYSATTELMELTDDQTSVMFASGQSKVENRIGWAMSALSQAGAVERPARATYRITETGRQALRDHPDGITQADLRKFPSWVEHDEAKAARRARSGASTAPDETEATTGDSTPEDQITSAIDELHSTVSDELLQRLQDGSPDFFEDAVVKLLLAMDYGGAEQRGMKVGGTADGGIDGFVDQDPLGLERVYIQAKRYSTGNGIGRETLQAFIGALHGRGAAKGVFITTSHFTKLAREYADNLPTRVVLIDGERLTSLMIKYRVGVQVKQTYEVVTVDEDFFE